MSTAKTGKQDIVQPVAGMEEDLCPGGGRHAAGEDPAKREQILEGARRAFLSQGFDAASMNDITREAGVSRARSTSISKTRKTFSRR